MNLYDAYSFLMANPKCLSMVGLFLDLIGITVLFFFQVDRNHHLKPDGSINLVTEQNEPAESRKWKQYRRLTVFGFLLLITGFALQFLATFFQ